MKLRTKIIIAASILILAIVIILLAFSNRDTVRVEVIAIPEDSSITLDGQPIEAGPVDLELGTHTLTASREFFGDAVVTINTEDIEPGEPVYLLPIPNTPEAQELLRNDSQMQYRREAAAGVESEQTQRSLTRQYPFLEELPYKNPDFQINYGFDDSQQLFLTVTVSLPAAVVEGTPEYDTWYERVKQDAVDYMESIEINTESTRIDYKINQF